MIFALIPGILALAGLGFNFMNKGKAKTILRIALVVIVVLSTPLFVGRTMLIGFINPFGSKTEDIGNYLVVDDYLSREDFRIFPSAIPESATDVTYYYRYRYCVEADYDIYLEMRLSRDDFEAEKSRIVRMFPDVDVKPNERDAKFTDYRVTYKPSALSYYYTFVSFSESTLEVRYIIAGTVDSANGAIKPYFLEK